MDEILPQASHAAHASTGTKYTIFRDGHPIVGLGSLTADSAVATAAFFRDSEPSAIYTIETTDAQEAGDAVQVLTGLHVAAKIHHADGSVTPAANSKRLIPETVQVRDIYGYADLIEGIRANRLKFIIRGTVDVQAAASDIPGRVYRRNAFTRDTAQHRITFDVDGADLGIDPVGNLEEAVRRLRARVPAPFASATCHAKLSGSARAGGTVLKAHVTFWSEVPLTGMQAKAYLEQVAVDPSLRIDLSTFRKIQPLFVADPILADGVADPLAGHQRIIVLKGERDSVDLAWNPPEHVEETGSAAERDSSDAVDGDEFLEYLYEHGHVIGEMDRAGRVPLRCPFDTQHDGPGGPTSTVAMVAGTGGHSFTAVKCLHTACSHRNTEEFKAAYGFNAALLVKVFSKQPPALPSPIPQGAVAIPAAPAMSLDDLKLAAVVWTDKGIPAEADDPLFKKILRGRKTRAYGPQREHLTTAHLINADYTRLPLAFPTSPPSAGWDRQAAEVALAMRIFEFTGDDCARVARMLERCNSLLQSNKPGHLRHIVTVAAAGYSVKMAKSADVPPFDTDPGTGKFDASLGNLNLALQFPQFAGITLRFDEFLTEIIIGFTDDPTQDARPLSDTDAVRFRRRLEAAGFRKIGRELCRDAFMEEADSNSFDSLIDWAENLPPWDGVPRVERFYETHFGIADTPYTRAVGRYTWTGLAGRALQPGIKADMVPTLVGPQGKQKSWAFRAMAPRPEAFGELAFDEKNEDNRARKIVGLVVAELAELRGLLTADLEAIKAWIVQQFETWIPKFLEHKRRYGRRCLFFATSNRSDFLADETGERRWLPMTVTGNIDIPAIERDRDQLWAEGIKLFRESGIAWKDAEVLAEAEHPKYSATDPWTEAVRSYLQTRVQIPPGCEPGAFTTSEILSAVGVGIKDQSRAQENRIGKIMRRLKYCSRQLTIKGILGRRWLAPTHPSYEHP